MKEIVFVKFKKLTPTAKAPFHGTKYSAGWDLYATDDPSVDNKGNIIYHTGIAVSIPKGYAGYLFPRSSNADTDLILTNSVGVIDSDYRGEVMMKFKKSMRLPTLSTLLRFAVQKLFKRNYCIKKAEVINWGQHYTKGDRIGQLVILPTPRVKYYEVDTLDDTERGEGGYGSTGK